MQLALHLDESEVDGLIVRKRADPLSFDIVLYETAEGGVGAIKALTEPRGIQSIASRARE